MPHKITKAIFPVGGLGTRFLPATKSMPKEMLPVVDQPLIQYAVIEAVEAGITEFIFVTGRGKSAIEDHFDHSTELEQTLRSRGKTEALATVQAMMHKPGAVTYIRQQEPAGLGHAVWCARHIIGDSPAAILLADDLIKPEAGGAGCLAQMVTAWQQYGGNMVAAMEVGREMTSSYGIITPGETLTNQGIVTEVKGLVEKPAPDKAPSQLAVVGRYIIEPSVFAVLDGMLGEQGAGGEIQLTDSLAKRIGKAPFHSLQFKGTRFDCGSKLGFQQANIAYALERADLARDLKAWLKTIIT